MVARIGAFTAACVLVSNAVGSGVFTTTGFLARDVGDPGIILVLWAIGGALALAGAMSYSELGAALPQVGGEYVYLRRAFGPIWGFLSGWTSFSIGFSAAIAAAGVAFAHYLIALAPGRLDPTHATAIALGLVWVLTGVHALGVEHGGRFQRWITIFKIGALVLLTCAGFALGEGAWQNLAAPVARASGDAEPWSLGAAAVGLVFVIYSYSGWNAAGYIAGEIRDPGRNLPRAMIGGTLLITGLYLAVNAVFFYALPVEALAAEPVLPVAEKAAAALFGTGAARVVSAVLCASIAGAVSSMIWAGPRVYQAMAADGLAPTALARVSGGAAPTRSILLQSVWVTLLIISGSFEQLVVYSGIAIALFSAAAVAALLVLRRREPELPRPYRVAFHPWVPLAYIAMSLGIAGWAAFDRPVEALLSMATVLAGVPLYLVWSRRQA